MQNHGHRTKINLDKQFIKLSWMGPTDHALMHGHGVTYLHSTSYDIIECISCKTQQQPTAVKACRWRHVHTNRPVVCITSTANIQRTLASCKFFFLLLCKSFNFSPDIATGHGCLHCITCTFTIDRRVRSTTYMHTVSRKPVALGDWTGIHFTSCCS